MGNNENKASLDPGTGCGTGTGIRTQLNFSQALELIKQGKRFCRVGWNGKNQYIELQRPDENSKMTLPYIYMVIAGNIGPDSSEPAKLVPWLASQTDLLAEDWVELELTDCGP